jgi:nitrogen PTS system EIIA component
MPSICENDFMSSWSDKGAVRHPAIKIAELLSPQTVVFAESGQGKTVLLDTLIDRVCARHGLADKQALGAKVREREQGISTTLDTGVSLPHARVDGLAAVVAGLGLARAPIVDPKSPEIPLRAMFLFFSPNKQELFGMHLQVLRGVAALFSPPLLDKLAAARSADDVLALIRAAESPK